MAELDWRIPLSGESPKINTPFENLNLVLQTKANQQKVKANDLELRQKEKDAADQDALQQIWTQYGDDPATALKLTKARNPVLGMKMEAEMMQGTINKMKVHAAQIEEEDATTDKHLRRLYAVKDDPEMYPVARSMAVKEDPGLEQVLPPALDSEQSQAQFERAMEMGKQSRQILKGQRDQLLKMIDDARQASQVKETNRHNQAMEGNQQSDNERQAAAQSETARHNAAMEAIGRARANRPSGGGSGGADRSDADAIADAIIRGEQPPETTGLYRMGPLVRSAMAKKGYNQQEALTDWRATQKHVATLNGAQQTRMGQAIDNAAHSLDVIEELTKKWDAGRFPPLNRAQLAAAKNGIMGKDAQALATQLEGQISDVTSELANVYMGGNSPTDHALTLAAKNLSADWSRDQLLGMVAQSKRNLQIRANSMKNVGVAGASPNNPYAAPGQQEIQGQTGGAPKVGDIKTFPNGNKGRFDGKGWELIKP